MIATERVYDRSATKGTRILVDRLWPRGIKKEAVDLWVKEVAPSDNLRKWFAHKEERWPEFKKRYKEELKGKTAEIKKIKELARKGNILLLFGAKDQERNNAVVLKEFIEQK